MNVILKQNPPTSTSTPCGGCGQRPRISIPVPGLTHRVGSGDLAATLFSRAGVTPCGGCKGRAKTMNRAVGFRPIGWA